MMMFAVAAAVLVALAMLFVAPPLLRRRTGPKSSAGPDLAIHHTGACHLAKFVHICCCNSHFIKFLILLY